MLIYNALDLELVTIWNKNPSVKMIMVMVSVLQALYNVTHLFLVRQPHIKVNTESDTGTEMGENTCRFCIPMVLTLTVNTGTKMGERWLCQNKNQRIFCFH